MANTHKRTENAVLTIRSRLEFEQDEPEWSELNTKAVFRCRGDAARITYTDLDDRGEKIGKTDVTVTGIRRSSPLVSIHKTGFTDTLMILEPGKTHPVSYETMFGTIHMQLHALEVRAALSPTGGEIFLRYSMNLGDRSENVNTVILRVTMQAQNEHPAPHRSS